jgi:hypothetical protein
MDPQPTTAEISEESVENNTYSTYHVDKPKDQVCNLIKK